MAFGSWEDVIDIYERLYLPSRYNWEAQQLLDIIPVLQKNSLVRQLNPGTSHGTLFLEMSGKQTDIRIFPEIESKAFNIQLYNPLKNKVVEQKTLPREQVVDVVEEYILKLKNDASVP